MVQDIRLVCVHEDNCAHLYQDTGPVNKIVRLPENVSSTYLLSCPNIHLKRAVRPERVRARG